ncbi:MAG: hypothetical protein Q7T82_00240 [Armatimonadota bacterium]|nr:hypothetical protein [Armatimonadota bacterium]
MGVVGRTSTDCHRSILWLQAGVKEQPHIVFERFLMARITFGVALAVFVLGLSVEAIGLERQLAGITLGAQMTVALKRYGNPTRISVGNNSGPGSVAGSPGAPSPAGMMRGGAGRDLSPFAGLGAGLGPGALPGLSSVGGMPGTAPMPLGLLPGVPGAPGTGANEQPPGSDDIRWTYELPKGKTVEFIVNDGLISQITVSGSKAFEGVKTSKGVTIGDNYKKVLMSYGYPDKQEYVGRYLRVGYLERSNIMFTLRDSKTVVGITIGFKQ